MSARARRYCELFLAQLKLYLASISQYRFDFLIMILSVAIGCVVEIALWRLVMKDSGHVQGYGLKEFIVYLVIANVVNMLNVNWDAVMAMAGEIRSGSVSRHLLRPISLFTVATADWLATKIPTLAGAIPTFIGLWWLMPAYFRPGASEVSMFLALLALSFWLCAELYFLIILATFWILETNGMAVAFNILRWAFAGQAFPLAFYPKWLTLVLDATPFPYFVYYPTLALMGRLSPSLFAVKIGIGLLMAVALSSLRRVVWHLAEHRLQTVGG